MKELKWHKKMLRKTYGSLDEIPLWDINELAYMFPDITPKEVYRAFNR